MAFDLLVPYAGCPCEVGHKRKRALPRMNEVKRILVIDDDSVTRDGVAEVLQEEGYAVAVAADGHEGVRQFTAFHPHLVLTDLQMPRLNGLGVITHIQSVAPATPIILCTADIALDATRKAQSLGIAGYLNKPFEFTHMLDQIAKAL
jgi:CheY-like chemotaxis protein